MRSTLPLLVGLLARAAAGSSADWLEDNKRSHPDLVELPNGLQYRVLESGSSSGERPNANSLCECHYEGRLVDGSIFDSSHARGRPATFKPSKVVPGWTLALQMMRPGDKWQLFLPPSLGYGEAGMPPRIPPSAVLIFELELLSVSEEAPMTFLQTVAYGILTLAFGYAGPDPSPKFLTRRHPHARVWPRRRGAAPPSEEGRAGSSFSDPSLHTS
mmetsp:Transcript_22848/g.77149  ORF Transcript_22848/g.77149 Transcript_22848/m.77149 type:complete len:215 (-) Transcript_22848:13-657(-)